MFQHTLINDLESSLYLHLKNYEVGLIFNLKMHPMIRSNILSQTKISLYFKMSLK